MSEWASQSSHPVRETSREAVHLELRWPTRHGESMTSSRSCFQVIDSLFRISLVKDRRMKERVCRQKNSLHVIV